MTNNPTIKVLIVDDSPTARQLLRAILEDDGHFTIIGEAVNGEEAIEMNGRLAPNLIIMDVHMPVLDGLEATKEIMAHRPTPIVVVSAPGNTQDLNLSLSATQAGALIALVKPAGPSSPRFADDSAELIRMARAMSEVKVVRRWNPGNDSSAPKRASKRSVPVSVQIVAIAASTGGPPALRRLLMDLPNDFPVPVLLVQHIARDFAAGFADWLGGSTVLHVKLGQQDEIARSGTVYVAPDDRHLGIAADGRLVLSNAPPENGFRPSADHLFGSVAKAYGRGMLGVIMTGMGSDGADGLATARRAGAFVIAQDEQSSVVYGMACEAVKRGGVDEIVPLDRIAARILSIVGGRNG